MFVSFQDNMRCSCLDLTRIIDEAASKMIQLGQTYYLGGTYKLTFIFGEC